MLHTGIKKRMIAVFAMLAVFISLLPTAFAEYTDSVIIKLNGQTLLLDNAAFESGGVVLTPVRDLMEAADRTVTWIGLARAAMITGDDTVAAVYEDRTVYEVNYVQKQAAAAAIMYNNTLYCSADAAAAILGMDCEYNGVTKVLSLEYSAETGETNEDIRSISPYEDTYVQGGTSSDLNFGQEENLGVKGLAGDTNRLIYLKFNISGLTSEMVGKAHLNMTSNRRTTENINNVQDFYFHDVAPGSWDESTLTFLTQPEAGELVLTAGPVWSTSMSFDLTDYVKNAAASGKSQISLVISGPADGTRVEFYSREQGSGPVLLIDADPSSYRTDLPTMEGFGEGKDPWEWAQKLLAESKYEKSERFETEYITRVSNAKYRVTPTDDAFAQAGSDSNTNFGDSNVLETKVYAETSTAARESFLKFDISELPAGDIVYAYVNLYCTNLENKTAHNEQLRYAVGAWDEDTVTWSNRPAAGELIAQTQITDTGRWYKFDLTDLVARARQTQESVLSFALTDTASIRTTFASKESSNSPELIICVDDGSRDFVKTPPDDPSEYSLSVDTIVKTDRTRTVSQPTRMLETLPGYTITAQEPQLGRYGGRLDRQVEATGFYYTKFIDGRWWIVDPEGYLMINMGVTTVTPGTSTPLGKAGMEREYGTPENWAEQTASLLKNDLYFNGVGGFSQIDYLGTTTAGSEMGMVSIAYMLRSYMAEIGISYAKTGSTMFENGAFNVFDPDFETFCDSRAAEVVAPKKDWANLLGWMSDNELQCDSTMLDSFLAADWTDPRNAYTYAAAWTFLKDYTGKEYPALTDVDDIMRQDFLDFMYDRYNKVVSEAIHKYAPNHMYLGVRTVDKAYQSRGFWAAAGRYCNAVCVNYYGAWTPDSNQMTDWSEWGGNVPFIATEWYAMATDSGLACSSGAGFLVNTQQDRGKFYQNFALKLLETKSCVGFHWFQYLDNDPTAVAGDSSNVDSNKGIINIFTYKPYTELTTEMAELNKQAYRVIDYFDN